MPKYKVVCIEKDDTFRETVLGDLQEAKILCSLLKDLFIYGVPDIYSLTIYADEEVVYQETFG